MTDRFLLFATFFALFLLAMSSGCMGDEFPQINPNAVDDDDDNDDNDNDDNNDDNNDDHDNDDNNNDSSDDDDDDDEMLMLTSGHDGWREPNCWASGCHTSDSHNSGMDPYQCVACHGNNGTKSEHKAGQNCSQCHNNPSDHPNGTFPNNSCTACHI